MHNQHRLLKVLKLISVLKAQPPKSVKLLAKQFETSERSIYRYIDLLKEVGFEVEKDKSNKIYIENFDNQLNAIFTNEEAEFIKTTVLQLGNNHVLRNSVLLKLNLYSEIEEIGIDISKAHLGQMIKTIQTAIDNKTQVILKSYFSVNSNSVSDRRIEPIQFTADYSYIFSYELETKTNKLFATDRFKEVKTTDVSFKFSEFHQFEGMDIFNFANTGEIFSIDLMLNLRAYILLKKEFPLVEKHIKVNMKTNQFHLQSKIFNLKPIARFVKGLHNDDVKVLGSEEFIEYLKSY
jgi:proteasome accessory factor C